MIFEDLPTTPTAEEVLDKAFSRAARAGRAKGGLEAQQSMLQTAANICSDNLENVVTSWPDFDRDVDAFYLELADAILREEFDLDETGATDETVTEGETRDTEVADIETAEAARTDPPVSPSTDEDPPRSSHVQSGHPGVARLRQHLSRVGWAGRKSREIHQEYQPRLRKTDVETARKHRKQAFARLADVVESVGADLAAIGTARDALRTLPDIDPAEPTIVVAGYPNVGKSSFVNAVTRARGETATYPFTTTGIGVGHLERDHVRYQVVDTPGLLDRPPAERNEIEAQAVSALEHLGDCVLVLVDPTETCGYPIADQLALRDAVAERFEARSVPVLTVANKLDLFDDEGGEGRPELAADHHMSVETGEGVETVLEAAIEAIGHEPELPFER